MIKILLNYIKMISKIVFYRYIKKIKNDQEFLNEEKNKLDYLLIEINKFDHRKD